MSWPKIFKKNLEKILRLAFLLFITSFFASCSNSLFPPYLLSLSTEIQTLEIQDNKLCESFKFFHNSIDSENRQLYWRCRLSLIRKHQKSDILKNSRNDQEAYALINKIEGIVKDEYNSGLYSEIKEFDLLDHKKCLDLGFVLQTNDRQKIEKYFTCRNRLIEEESEVVPFGDIKYHEPQNRTYRLGYIINQRLNEMIEEDKKRKAEFPQCQDFDIFSKKFTECVENFNKINSCLGLFKEKKRIIQRHQDFTCQKSAYLRFGDDLIENKVNESQKILIKKSFISDFQNSLNFEALGINEDIFSSLRQKKDNQNILTYLKSNDVIGVKNMTTKNIIKESQQKHYSRYEISVLRQRYINSCRKEMELELEKLEEESKSKCVASIKIY